MYGTVADRGGAVVWAALLAAAALHGCEVEPSNGAAEYDTAERTRGDNGENGDESSRRTRRQDQILSLPEAESSGALADVPTVEVTTHGDPAYGGEQTFRAWPLEHVLQQADLLPAEQAGLVVKFIAEDGYEATVPVSDLPVEDGYIAFRRSDASDANPWPTFSKGDSQITPAPYYLIWASSQHSDHRPWAYKLVRIGLHRATALWGHAVPPRTGDAGAGPSAELMAGFEVFREHCIKCHSVNRSGGSVGPELNVPMNVTEYWRRDHLRAYIRNPSNYRAGAEMPSFDQTLTERKMEELMRYLAGMATHKVCRTAEACAAHAPESTE